MSVFDKIRNMIGVSEEEYYDEDNEQLEVNEEVSEEAPPRRAFRETAASFTGDRKNKYVNFSNTTQLQVVLVKPERFDDAPSIADSLNEKKTVVLNLESVNKETARRLIDFLSGAAYANRGTIKRVAKNTFIITPNNVDVMGELILDELETGSAYFG
ncbi:MAG: cell division protein SepF [bacterium]|nr:cell division protein SepF [bacterium]